MLESPCNALQPATNVPEPYNLTTTPWDHAIILPNHYNPPPFMSAPPTNLNPLNTADDSYQVTFADIMPTNLVPVDLVWWPTTLQIFCHIIGNPLFAGLNKILEALESMVW